MNAAWVIRLTRLPADRKTELLIWKKITITTSPMMTGSAPLPPPRTCLAQIRRYSPTELAISSAEAPVRRAMSSGLSAPLSAVISPRSGAGFVDVKGQPSRPLSGVRASLPVRPLRCRPPVVISSTTDDVS